jgi:hypothetical protein
LPASDWKYAIEFIIWKTNRIKKAMMQHRYMTVILNLCVETHFLVAEDFQVCFENFWSYEKLKNIEENWYNLNLNLSLLSREPKKRLRTTDIYEIRRPLFCICYREKESKTAWQSFFTWIQKQFSTCGTCGFVQSVRWKKSSATRFRNRIKKILGKIYGGEIFAD